jgi:hypothetical protein
MRLGTRTGLQPDSRAGGETTRPPHSLGGRIGMGAELLRHLSNAATDADLLHGVLDCLGDHVGGWGV